MSLKTEKANSNWPKTIDEAAERLLTELSEKEKERLKNTPEDELIVFHFSLGIFVRNHFGLWAGNLCQSAMHPDDISSAIIKRAWEKLHE